MLHRLIADMNMLAAGDLAAAPAYLSDGTPAATIKSAAGDTIALIALKRRTFAGAGFNIVNDISASAGEGYPETECWVDMNSDNTKATLARHAKIFKLATAMGCSVMKVLSSAAPVEADLVDANVQAEIANDARLGQVGN